MDKKYRTKCRKIIHIDMDAFYAAVEQRNNPSLKGKVVIVGGDPHSRGVVSTCSYEGRKFGISSAMPSSKAYRICPEAIFIRPNFNEYKVVSSQIRSIFKDYTDKIEKVSLDEAYLDVSVNKKFIPYATLIAKEILHRIKVELDLSASAGVSYNKFLAKVGSGYKKPAGLTVITPEQGIEFIKRLPIEKFHGVGQVTLKTMHRLNILNGFDLLKFDLSELISHFGKVGAYYYDLARGIDNREVISYSPPKSISKECTFEENIINPEIIKQHLSDLCTEVSNVLKEREIIAKTLVLKIKYSDFKVITKSYSIEDSFMRESKDIFDNSVLVLNQILQNNIKPIRLLGLGVKNLFNIQNNISIDKKTKQLSLF